MYKNEIIWLIRRHNKPSLNTRPSFLRPGLLIFSSHILGLFEVMDKKTMKRIEDIEALPEEEKDKVYYFIGMAITHHKTKKAFAK